MATTRLGLAGIPRSPYGSFAGKTPEVVSATLLQFKRRRSNRVGPMIITAGSTNKSVYFYIQQDASNTSPGEPVTGLLYSDIETGGSASYMRQGAARADFTLVTLASAAAAHTDGGFIEVDATNMPGVYRCDVPDAAFATGVDQVIISIVVASANNAVAEPIYVDITDIDTRDAVRAGITALPNANADAAGGLPISDAGGLDLDAVLSGNTPQTGDCYARLGAPTGASVSADIATAQTDLDTITGTAGALLDTTATSAQLVDDIWDEALSGHTTAGTSGWNSLLAGAILQDTTITGTPTTTTLTLNAGSSVDDFYNDQLIYIVSGTGIGQVRPILDYNGTTKLVTVDEAWKTTPAASDRVIIQSSHVHPLTQIQNQILADATPFNGADIASILTDTGTTIPATLGTPVSSISADIATMDANVDQIETAVITNAAGVDIAADIAAVKAETSTIVTDTNELQTDWANGGRLDLILDSRMAEASINTTAGAVDNVTTVATTTTNTDMVAEPTTLLTTQMTEAYAADGTAPTLAQALFAIQQFLQERSTASTTVTVKKLDGSTSAMTFTLDDATTPTSITRAT